MRAQCNARDAGYAREGNADFGCRSANREKIQMSRGTKAPVDYIAAIRTSGLSIYDPIEVGSKLWIPSRELERILNDALRGFDTAGMPGR